jgi:hypothetical protein
MPAASSGHYAALSFVVRGGYDIINSGYWLLTPGYLIFCDFYGFYDFYGLNDFNGF